MQRGQLGHGDLLQRNVPTIIKKLSGKKVIAGAITVSASSLQNPFIARAAYQMLLHAVQHLPCAHL